MGQTAEPADLSAVIVGQAAEVLARAKQLRVSLVTAESCTGGLVSTLLTDIEGLSGAFERGFAVYSNSAKEQMLGVDAALIATAGPVSGDVARAMAAGALLNSEGHLAVAITGFAGPAGKFDEEGLVHLAGKSKRGHTIHRECHFGSVGRDRVRELAARGALEIFGELLDFWQSTQGENA
jgi:nicotinamide-nucleotide amidase